MEKEYFVSMEIRIRGVVEVEASCYEEAVSILEADIENDPEAAVNSIKGTRRVLLVPDADASYDIDTTGDVRKLK